MTSMVLVYASGRVEFLTPKLGSSVGVVIFSGKNQVIFGHVTLEIRYLFIHRGLEFSVKRELC